MEKFTKFESAIILNALTLGLDSDLKENQAVVDSGKNPIMTADYIKLIYEDLTERVKKMTRKNN